MRKLLIVSIISILFILSSWRNILLNINTQLPGWYDELFIIWIYQNNIRHLISFDFNNIYETNAIYPFKYTLSFAEQMYFPSFLVLIINIFTKNIIAQYNTLLILNHILIFFSALVFFNKIFKNSSAALISTLYTSFSPYFFTQISHFQMIFFWPLLLSLFFLAEYFEKSKIKNLLFSGILAGIQFLSSVYLGIMNVTIIFIWYISEILYKKIILKELPKQLSIIFMAFILVSSISIIGYILVNKEYHIKRDYGEYVTYSAHLTDYIFPSRQQLSLLYSSFPVKKFISYNHHNIGEFAVFAGFLPLIFAIYKLWPNIKLIKTNLKFDFSLTSLSSLCLLLIITGFILSLGPRLFVNGQFTDIPLPYDLVVKVFKPIGIIRVVARWNLLLILGFGILMGLGYVKLEQKLARYSKIKKNLIFTFILSLTFVEFYSLTPFPASYRNWQADRSYQFLKNEVCKSSNTTLLEYPFHYRNVDADVAKDVNYMAQILLNSTQHNCKILSGYYGYEPPKYIKIRDEFNNGFDEKDIKIIRDLKIKYLKFNKYAISKQEFERIQQSKILENFQKIYDTNNVLIFRINPINS